MVLGRAGRAVAREISPSSPRGTRGERGEVPLGGQPLSFFFFFYGDYRHLTAMEHLPEVAGAEVAGALPTASGNVFEVRSSHTDRKSVV